MPNIKLAIIDHISSASAILFPIKKIIEALKPFGILILIDGAHAPGQVPELGLEDLGADFYTGTLHKWTYATKGAAILWVDPRHQSWLKPLVKSHNYNKGFQAEFFQQVVGLLETVSILNQFSHAHSIVLLSIAFLLGKDTFFDMQVAMMALFFGRVKLLLLCRVANIVSKFNTMAVPLWPLEVHFSPAVHGVVVRTLSEKCPICHLGNRRLDTVPLCRGGFGLLSIRGRPKSHRQSCERASGFRPRAVYPVVPSGASTYSRVT